MRKDEFYNEMLFFIVTVGPFGIGCIMKNNMEYIQVVSAAEHMYNTMF